MLEKDLLNKVTQYLGDRSEIAFAFLFGSQARGIATNQSDVDIAVYFYPAVSSPLEIESDSTYDMENVIWADVENIVKKDVDMVVLNRAPATVAAAALRGRPLVIRDNSLYLDFMIAATDEADSFMDYIIKDFRDRHAI